MNIDLIKAAEYNAAKLFEHLQERVKSIEIGYEEDRCTMKIELIDFNGDFHDFIVLTDNGVKVDADAIAEMVAPSTID